MVSATQIKNIESFVLAHDFKHCTPEKVRIALVVRLNNVMCSPKIIQMLGNKPKLGKELLQMLLIGCISFIYSFMDSFILLKMLNGLIHFQSKPQVLNDICDIFWGSAVLLLSDFSPL